MTEQELIVRCRRHEIPYTAQTPTARLTLRALTEQADREGAAYLHARAAALGADACPDAADIAALHGAIGRAMTAVIDGIGEYLAVSGTDRHTISFAAAEVRLSDAAQAQLAQLRATVHAQEHALRLLCGACYRQLSALAQSEQSCLNCRITHRLIVYAAVLAEVAREDIETLDAGRRVRDAQCTQRRAAHREQLERALTLCEETVPSYLLDFLAVTVCDDKALRASEVIRACELLRTRLTSLRSLLFSENHA